MHLLFVQFLHSKDEFSQNKKPFLCTATQNDAPNNMILCLGKSGGIQQATFFVLHTHSNEYQ